MLFLLDKSVCCFFSSWCFSSFVNAPTKFCEGVQLTSEDISCPVLTWTKFEKYHLVSCNCTQVLHCCYLILVSGFLLIKSAMAFVKISLILLFTSLTALSSVARLASYAFWTLSISALLFDGSAGGIGGKTGSGETDVASICTCTKKSSGLSILWPNYRLWICSLWSSRRFGLHRWFISASFAASKSSLVACGNVLKNCRAWSNEWNWRNCSRLAFGILPTFIWLLRRLSKMASCHLLFRGMGSKKYVVLVLLLSLFSISCTPHTSLSPCKISGVQLIWIYSLVAIFSAWCEENSTQELNIFFEDYSQLFSSNPRMCSLSSYVLFTAS